MRTAFIKQLTEEAKINDKIFLIVGDLGFSVVEEFAKLFPDRFLNAGIAEQNTMGIAAGLAMEGYNVYVYSIANFPTLRCMEQIRYDVAYHNLNVKIVSIGAGYAYGSLGASHHATEDIGMMRSIPNMVVCSPADPVEAKAITSFSSTCEGPMYLRFGKAGEPIVHHEALLELSLGEILEISKGEINAVFTTGAMLKYVSDFISENNINASIYSFPFVKPINKDKLLTILESHSHIITIEEHQAQSGFGSAILETINDLREDGLLTDLPQIKRIAIPDQFYSVSGSQSYLRKNANLVLNVNMFNI